MLTLDNAKARRILMQRQGLGHDNRRRMTPADWLALIHQMGFVQVDSVRTLARAHDAILFSRNRTYRPAMLRRLLERETCLFENWTHDAAVIPCEFYPFWQLRFARERARLAERWRKWGREGFVAVLEEIIAHVEANGPTRARDLIDRAGRGSRGWWEWHPGKTALEYHWRTGRLAVAARKGFEKLYDLTERVIPADHREPDHEDQAMLDWICRASLERLGVATPGEIAAFFGHVSPLEAASWAARQNDLIEVGVSGHDGRVRKALAFHDIENDSELQAELPSTLRLLSPFDPVLRDRKRALRLFGFDYRIEIFVPAGQRRYGYYVFPVLEGDRIVGRIDAAHDRDRDAVVVRAFWPEEGVRMGKARTAALEAELDRYRRFCDAQRVIFENGWLRQA